MRVSRRGIRALGAGLVIAGLAACGGSQSEDPDGSAAEVAGDEEASDAAAPADGAPEVEETYQERINEAWQEAMAGENPATTCAAVKGRAVMAEPGTADRAMSACNLDIPVRYFQTYVDRVESGEATCQNLMMEFMTKLSAMTMSAEGFRDLARQGENADTSDAAATGAASAIIAGEAAAGGGANDPERAIKERLREPITAACPNEAAIILR